jgi:hypothetical protein
VGGLAYSPRGEPFAPPLIITVANPILKSEFEKNLKKMDFQLLEG